MSDKTLLELAAKAAGIDIYFDEDGDCYRVKESGNRKYWNPISFDGDALRLAVKLNLDIEFINGDTLVLNVSEGGGEPCARTRRAIVRAAAKIGEAMP